MKHLNTVDGSEIRRSPGMFLKPCFHNVRFTISTGEPDFFHQLYIFKIFCVFFWVEWFPSGGSSHLKVYLLMGGRLARVFF